MNTIIRQGDLVLLRTGPETPVDPPSVATLAVGGTSSHSHRLTCAVVREPSVDERGELVVIEPAELAIEGQGWRHDPITVPSGTYAYWVQRELGADEEVRLVQD